MGSCCCCRPNDNKKRKLTTDLLKTSVKNNPNITAMLLNKTVEKDIPLSEAILRTETTVGHPVEKVVLKRFLTTETLKELSQSANISKHWKILLTNTSFHEFSKIIDNLYLTGIGGITKENITKYNIKFIISVAFECPKYAVKGVDSIRLPVEDDPKEKLNPYFNEMSDKIENLLKNGINTVVHCMGGQNRSTTIVIAYLMKHKKMSLKESYMSIRERRLISNINPSFFSQLLDYELKLFGKTSANLVQILGKDGKTKYIPDFILNDKNKDIKIHEFNTIDASIYTLDSLYEKSVKKPNPIL